MTPATRNTEGSSAQEVIIGSGHEVSSYDANGKKRWAFAANGEISSPICIVDDMILFGSEDNNLYCLDPSGKLRWTYKTRGIITSKPTAINNGTQIVFSSHDRTTYILDKNGTRIDCFETKGIVVSEAHVAYLPRGPALIIGISSSDENIAYYDFESVKTFNHAHWVTSTPVTVRLDGRHYALFGSHDHFMYMMDIHKWDDAYIKIKLPHPITKNASLHITDENVNLFIPAGDSIFAYEIR